MYCHNSIQLVLLLSVGINYMKNVWHGQCRVKYHFNPVYLNQCMVLMDVRARTLPLKACETWFHVLLTLAVNRNSRNEVMYAAVLLHAHGRRLVARFSSTFCTSPYPDFCGKLFQHLSLIRSVYLLFNILVTSTLWNIVNKLKIVGVCFTIKY